MITLLRFSLRIVTREWRSFVLPFASLTITALMIMLGLGITDSVRAYLTAQEQALNGGDVRLLSSFPIPDDVFEPLLPREHLRTSIIEWTGTVQAGSTTAAVEVRVIDRNYPLYGTLELASSTYRGLESHELLLDANAAARLQVTQGSAVTVGTTTFTVADIITREPDALLASFKLFPTVIMTEAAFGRTGIGALLLRAEYERAYAARLDSATRDTLQAQAEEQGIRIRFAGDSQGGVSLGLETLTKFLTVALLITALLAAVNVYASVVYLVERLKRNIAVLRALGLTAGRSRAMIIVAFLYISLSATLIGQMGGILLVSILLDTARERLQLPVELSLGAFDIGVVLAVVLFIGLAALIPGSERLLRARPRDLLTRTEQAYTPTKARFLYNVVLIATPVILFLTYVLGSLTAALLTLASILGVYLLVALLYSGALSSAYARRAGRGFLLRSILAWKKYDGVFGVVAFTSLFVALTSLFTLALAERSLTRFLNDDVGARVPALYVIDVQEGQAGAIRASAPGMTLFPNVPGRIDGIDDLNVQDALATGEPPIDRELGREFNLTYRTALLESERVYEGSGEIGLPGTISVDRSFAERAGIRVGSRVRMLIQGVPLEAEVTTIHESDTRSGLPFFYFIYSPSDLERFPTTHFGYAYEGQVDVTTFTQTLARSMPNVTVLNTSEIGVYIQDIITVLVTIVFLTALPPFVLACILIVVLILLEYSTRRRDGARLLMLGEKPARILATYVLETVWTTGTAMAAGYVAAVVATGIVAKQYLELSSFVAYTPELLLGSLCIILTIVVLSLWLWKSDRRPLREVLAYEDTE